MKYNKTLHLPWSENCSDDDKIAKDVSNLINNYIIITEKIDGSNTSLEKAGCFARTHTSPPTHKSFDMLKALHASIKYQIDDGMQYFGEWVFAKHSIYYNALPGYFLLFAVRYIPDNYWSSWDKVMECSQNIQVPTVPILWSGRVRSINALQSLTIKLASEKSLCGTEREGIVVRTYNGFSNKDFARCVMKFVRKNFNQTDNHWKHQKITQNKLKDDK